MKPIIKQSFISADTAPIAFFCSEYAVTSDESMYAGGLGVLAGDFLLEAGDENMPLVALGLKYAKTKTAENGLELLTGSDGKPILVEVPIGESTNAKKVFLQAWVKRFGEKTFLLLLDCDIPDNVPEDRNIGDLYDQNLFTHLKQQIFLGIGGFIMLKLLGIEPKKYHLHEGNAAFAGLAMLAEGFPGLCQDHDALLKAIRAKVVSTKHTILSIGTKISAAEIWKIVGAYCGEFGIGKDFLMSLGAYKNDQNLFATTRFLINLSGKSNAVSAIHAAFEKQKYPTESHLLSVTNGVYLPRWQDEKWRLKGGITKLSYEKIWSIKNELRKELIESIEKTSGIKLDPNVCTLIWSRRFVSYKRPLAIFTDMARLRNILFDDTKPLQIVVSGKIAGTDAESIHMMEVVRDAALNPLFKGKIAFVPNDSVDMEKKFVAGCDVWLNTPKRGVEACGTSGMKAGLNGALMMSVSDGWMDEVNWSGIGWILPDNNNSDFAVSIYELLEREVLPEFYKRNKKGVPKRWVARMRNTMNIVVNDFSAAKMLEGYRKEMYGSNGNDNVGFYCYNVLNKLWRYFHQKKV